MRVRVLTKICVDNMLRWKGEGGGGGGGGQLGKKIKIWVNRSWTELG